MFTIAIFVLFCVSITRFTKYLTYDQDAYNVISLWVLTAVSYVVAFKYFVRHMVGIYVGMDATEGHS